MSNDIHSRLDYLFGGLKPTIPDDEPQERLTPGEQLIASDPSLWALVQKHRQATYEQESLRQEQREIMESLSEAAEAAGLSHAELQERLYQANHARGASAPLDFDGNFPGEDFPDADYKRRQVQEAEQWAQILEGNRAMIAREEAYAAQMRGDPVPGNHDNEVPAD